MLRKETKWSYIKCSIKTRKCRKRQEDTKSNKEQEQQVKNSNKMVDIKSTISVITLTINGLNEPTKRERLSESKNKTQLMLSTRNLEI